MGACGSHGENLNDSSKTEKEDLLQSIRTNLKLMDEYIQKLRKEDVHYRMTKLIFMLNSIKEILPFIRNIEDSNSSNDFNPVKIKFEEIFSSIWRYDWDKY
jgi:hypothetical protein